MDKSERQCFIMLCYKYTESFMPEGANVCGKKSHFPDLRPIKKGDIGFLYNMSSDELLGVFVAKDRVKLNVRDDQWWLLNVSA